MRKIVFLAALFVVMIVPAFAQNLSSCSIVGTWYGGSEYKYLITYTPINGGRFSISGTADFSWEPFGFKVATSFQGELDKLSDGRYLGQIIQLYTTSSDVPPPENSDGLNAARLWLEFTGDCNHMTQTIDFFAAYFDLNKLPFVDLPDYYYLPPGGKIIETYTRMPMTCPACNN